MTNKPSDADGEHRPAAAPEPHDVTVQARRSPRYGRFMALGALLGAIVGFVIAQASAPPVGVDTGPVIPFITVVGGVVGVTVGAVVAVLLDAALTRRAKRVTATRTRHHDDEQ